MEKRSNAMKIFTESKPAMQGLFMKFFYSQKRRRYAILQ